VPQPLRDRVPPGVKGLIFKFLLLVADIRVFEFSVREMNIAVRFQL
jgi:hypothetical protein